MKTYNSGGESMSCVMSRGVVFKKAKKKLIELCETSPIFHQTNSATLLVHEKIRRRQKDRWSSSTTCDLWERSFRVYRGIDTITIYTESRPEYIRNLRMMTFTNYT